MMPALRTPTTHRCSSCGHRFDATDVPTASDVLTTTETYIPLEAFTHVSCPACGRVELAEERRFFGALGPRGLQILVGAMLFGFVLAVVVTSL